MVATMERAGQMPRLVAETCERLAGKIIQETDAHSVSELLELEHMDVVAAGVAGAVKAWPNFDPDRGIQPQTFLYRPIHSAIFDYLRKEGSQSRRINGLKREMGDSQPIIDKERELADWLKDVYESAKRVYVGRRMNQGRTYPAPQAVAIARLMQRENLSGRAAARLLAQRDDLRAVLKMKHHCPHFNTMNRAARLIGRNGLDQVGSLSS